MPRMKSYLHSQGHGIKKGFRRSSKKFPKSCFTVIQRIMQAVISHISYHSETT